jgi:hypothetical protein
MAMAMARIVGTFWPLLPTVISTPPELSVARR